MFQFKIKRNLIYSGKNESRDKEIQLENWFNHFK